MRVGTRIMSMIYVALLCVSTVVAQRTPAGGAVEITSVSPAVLETTNDPTEVTLTGKGFDAKAVVRMRKTGNQGSGLDYVATVESATRLRVRVPADLLDRVGTIELRVKNPDGKTSEWKAVEVKARTVPGGGGDPGARKPVVDRVSPSRIEAQSRNVHVTIYGRDLADGAVAQFSAGSTKAEARGNLVNNTLVILFPDELLAKPQAVIMTVRNPGGGVSDQVRLDVVEPSGAPTPGDTNDPFISQIDPQRLDMRTATSQELEITGRGIDRDHAKVLLRVEGSSETGKAVPVVRRDAATNGVVLTIQLTRQMVNDSGAYELRVVNANGRQSNWVRVEVLGGDPGVGNTGAVIDAKFPESLTLTSVTRTMPVELTVKNTGRSPIRLGDFAVVTPENTRTVVPGSIDVPVGETRTQRLEAPIPVATGAGSKGVTKVQVAFVYKVTLVSSRNPSFDGRTPADGFATVSVRNEIGLADIGREYVTADTASGAEGWRFFKSDNPTNEGEGRAADFYLFAEPLAGQNASEELYNYRPDSSVPNNRGLFYLVLRNNEISAIDARARERGTRLGYVAKSEAPGLVALYRWVLSDGRRTVNHYLTTEREASRLPRQMQKPGWKLDVVLGYVVPKR